MSSEEGDMDDKEPYVPKYAADEERPRKRTIGIGIAALVLVLVVAGAAVWWTVLRDDSPSETTAQVSVSGDQISADGGVRIVQIPSLAASATIDGIPADGPIDITFGEPSELVVSVVNNGNLTMDDITVTLELTIAAGDTAVSAESGSCALPLLDPQESADCTLSFVATDDMTAVVARVLGYGPQEQEVEVAVNIALG